VLFSRQILDDEKFSNLFSVVFAAQSSVKNRTIVFYSGDDTGLGEWFCRRDRTGACGHITKACHGLQQLILADPTARDAAVGVDTEDPAVTAPG
jgi:hypothetical protein